MDRHPVQYGDAARLHIPLHVEEYVGRLEIAMHDSSCMKICESGEDLNGRVLSECSSFEHALRRI